MPFSFGVSRVTTCLPNISTFQHKIMKLPPSTEALRMARGGVRFGDNNGSPSIKLFGRTIKIPGNKIVHSVENMKAIDYQKHYKEKCTSAMRLLLKDITAMPLDGEKGKNLKQTLLDAGVMPAVAMRNGKEYFAGLSGDEITVSAAQALITYHSEYMTSSNRPLTFHEVEAAEKSQRVENPYMPSTKYGVLHTTLAKSFGRFHPVRGVVEKLATENEISDNQSSKKLNLVVESIAEMDVEK